MNPRDVPVFILAGGLGTRFREQTHSVPKPMIEVGGRPILWHIMTKYASHGFRRFVICAGYRQEIVKDYFLNYQAINSDFTVNLGTRGVEYHSSALEDWEVTVADTGATSMTGHRIFDATRRFLRPEDKIFAVTYGDGLTDADLNVELDWHVGHGKIATVLGIHPPARFGEIRAAADGSVEVFAEKRALETSWISGGFFFFNREFTDVLTPEEDLVLENAPMEELVKRDELRLFQHAGFWACMDTQRDHDYLESLIASGEAPWLTH